METTENKQLAIVVERNGLTFDRAKELLETFDPIFVAADKMRTEAEAISVTDATQVTEIKQARVLRLQIKAKRVEVEKVRKTLKEESLVHGRIIDQMAKVITDLIEPIENRLEEQEKFAERAEAARKKAIADGRSALLAPFVENVAVYPLADMTDSAFTELLNGAKLAQAAKAAAAKKAEEDRIAVEQARVEEEKRIRAENERLRQEKAAAETEARKAAELAAKERAAIEATAKAEREAAEAEARREREARERVEAAQRAERAKEAKRLADEEKARKKAEAAPDSEKLLALAKTLRGITTPKMVTDSGHDAAVRVLRKLSEVADFAEGMAGDLV